MINAIEEQRKVLVKMIENGNYRDTIHNFKSLDELKAALTGYDLAIEMIVFQNELFADFNFYQSGAYKRLLEKRELNSIDLRQVADYKNNKTTHPKGIEILEEVVNNRGLQKLIKINNEKEGSK